MRIDKLLWLLRFAPSRTVAHDWVCAGHMRVGGRRIERASTAIRPGDVLTLPLRGGVRVIEVLALPTRRGPAAEARELYRVLDEGRANPIAAPDSQMPEGTSLP